METVQINTINFDAWSYDRLPRTERELMVQGIRIRGQKDVVTLVRKAGRRGLNPMNERDHIAVSASYYAGERTIKAQIV